LPLLTQHTGVYTDLGYVSEGELDDLSVEDAYKLFSTPYVAFSNYSDLPSTWGDISPFFLGALVADAAGIDINLYYHFLLQSFTDFQAMNPYFYIVDDSVCDEPGDDIQADIEMFAAFQYDMLFGEGYSDDIMSGLSGSGDE